MRERIIVVFLKRVEEQNRRRAAPLALDDLDDLRASPGPVLRLYLLELVENPLDDLAHRSPVPRHAAVPRRRALVGIARRDRGVLRVGGLFRPVSMPHAYLLDPSAERGEIPGQVRPGPRKEPRECRDLVLRDPIHEFYLADRVPDERLAEKMHRLIVRLRHIELEIEPAHDTAREYELDRFLPLESGVEMDKRRTEGAFDGGVTRRKKAGLENELRKGLHNLPELLKLVRQRFENGMHRRRSPFTPCDY